MTVIQFSANHRKRNEKSAKAKSKHLTYNTKPKSKHRPEIWTSIDAEKLMKSSTNFPNNIEIKITNPKPAMQKQTEINQTQTQTEQNMNLEQNRDL